MEILLYTILICFMLYNIVNILATIISFILILLIEINIKFMKLNISSIFVFLISIALFIGIIFIIPVIKWIFLEKSIITGSLLIISLLFILLFATFFLIIATKQVFQNTNINISNVFGYLQRFLLLIIITVLIQSAITRGHAFDFEKYKPITYLFQTTVLGILLWAAQFKIT